MVWEIFYPSGHRQVWRRIDDADSKERGIYDCITYSPEGDPLEFRILGHKQLERTIKRVRRQGGEVRERSLDDYPTM